MNILNKDDMAEQIGRELYSRFGGLDFWHLSRESKEVVCQEEAKSLLRELEYYFEELRKSK